MAARLLFASIFVAVAFETIFAARDDSCVTPNGENAKCVPVNTCEVIVKAVITRNSTAIEFAKKSQCGFDTGPLVCCGSSGYPNNSTLLEITTTKRKPVVLTDYGPKEIPDRSVCGLQTGENRIIGGTATDIGEFPWTAVLEYKSRKTGQTAGIRCGGSLLNTRYILTSAHCVLDQEFELVSVRLGECIATADTDEEVNNNNSKSATFAVKDIIPHPFYSTSTRNNDIALLQLEHDLNYTECIRPICLPPLNLPELETGDSVIVVGRGANENGTSANINSKATLAFIETDDCNKQLKTANVKLNPNQFCAQNKDGSGSCKGEPGGPVMRVYEDALFQEAQMFLEGVLSRNAGCGFTEYPVIYSQVPRYISWIINVISS